MPSRLGQRSTAVAVEAAVPAAVISFDKKEGLSSERMLSTIVATMPKRTGSFIESCCVLLCNHHHWLAQLPTVKPSDESEIFLLKRLRTVRFCKHFFYSYNCNSANCCSSGASTSFYSHPLRSYLRSDMSAAHFAVQARAFTSISTKSTSVRSNARSMGAKRFPGSQRQSHVCSVVDRRETAEQVRITTFYGQNSTLIFY
jgi:hypothetical protein